MNNETNTNNNVSEQPVIINSNQVNNNPVNTGSVATNSTVNSNTGVTVTPQTAGVSVTPQTNVVPATLQTTGTPATPQTNGVVNPTNVVPNNQVNLVQSNSNLNPNATNQVNPNGNGEVVPENLKSVEIDYKPPSKFKVFVLIVFFGGLIAFVIFLPEITEMVNKYNSREVQEEKIVDGKLLCNMESTTENLTNTYDVNFTFRDNKAETVKFITDVKGSATEDADTLNKLNDECKLLKEHAKGMDGINISCEYSEGLLEKKQSFELANVDFETLDSVFAEAGGSVPEYRFGDDMDQIEKSMKAAGYSCVRER